MRLKRLEIFGFKSFAKKLDLKLVGGITAVVGPNGCGKTNVVDSIRWVLGEQRPTQIRLDRMEDVLFKGSDIRRQLGMAEVSLTLDNESRTLPLDMPEITITRRLFRTGESDYMINRKTCRLADINDLFMDTGMGTDSYSMFEQDMINSILSDKAEDRRHIFEEAAGVTKYKTRRKSAIGKMESIEVDLERVGDIITELERRVDSLKRQASKAERYRKLKTDIKDRTVTIAAYEISALTDDLDHVCRVLETLKTSSSALSAKTAGFTAEYEGLSVDMVTVEKELAENAGILDDNLTAVNEKEKDLARLGSEIKYLGEKADRARQESRHAKESLEKLAESHGLASENLSTVSARLEEVVQAISALVDGYRSFETRVREKSEAVKAIEQEYRRVERELAEQRSALDTVRIWGENGDKRLQEIAERTGEVERSISDADTEIERLRNNMQDVSEKEQGIIVLIDGLKETIAGKTAELEKLAVQLGELRESEASVRAERDFLAGLVLTCEGYSDGVRNAVTAGQLQGRVIGALGDMISADKRYIRAVEAALEDRLQNVLVRSRDDALAGIRYLAETGQGRATFLPLEAAPDAGHNPRIPEGEGVIGPAWKFVTTGQRFQPVVKRLLESAVIVDTIETAIGLQRTTEGLVFVTLAGEKAGPLGDLQGGSGGAGESGSFIGRKEQLEVLDLTLENADMECEMIAGNRQALSDEIDNLRALITEHETSLASARRELQELKSRENQTAARRDAAAEMLENWTAEGNRIMYSFHGYESEKAMLSKGIELREQELTAAGERLTEASEELNAMRIELEKQRSDVNSFSVEKATLTEKKASLEREIAYLGERREALAHTSNRMLEESEETEREILEAGRAKCTVTEELETLSARHEQLRAAKDDIERRHAELSSRRSEIDHEIQNLRREQTELAQRESALNLKRDQASMRIQAIMERLDQDFYVSAEDIPLGETPPDYDPEQERLLLEDLRRKLQTIGDVNMTAEAEYRQEKERLDFLRGERDDLVEARNTILETITKINLIARRRFKETFDLIRLNFQKTFNEFFEGGSCDISLEEDEDPLEAKIKIAACPPGKNVRSINLLSSGERALTAIAMLFAIYQVKPSPFCILDEVDAPLDDANIDRYLRVIRRFSQSTQFIMVTHNKKTMASADNLYGITMEEPGLSSLVSVRLSRTDGEPVKVVKETKGEVAVE